VYNLQGGPNAILKEELLLGKLLFINSLADVGALLITAFQHNFIFKTGIFLLPEDGTYTCAETCRRGAFNVCIN
jgi:hypothetical protein